MPAIRPCLWFDDQGEQAATLYTSIFPNSRIVDVTRYPADTPGPEGAVMTVEFELDGQRMTALNGGPQFTFSEAVSFQIECADQAEVDHYWTSLTADGGSEGPCGWAKDKFGLSWQVVPTALESLLRDPDPDRAHRAMQAMLKMSKLDIAALEQAADAG